MCWSGLREWKIDSEVPEGRLAYAVCIPTHMCLILTTRLPWRGTSLMWFRNEGTVVGLAKTRLAGEELGCAGQANAEETVGMIFAKSRTDGWFTTQQL
jgi:hypothetical protein